MVAQKHQIDDIIYNTTNWFFKFSKYNKCKTKREREYFRCNTSTNCIVITKNGALFDGTVGTEHDPNVILRNLL